MRSFFTVSTTNTRNVFSGNGSTTAFPTDFVFLLASHLTVTLFNSDGDKINPAGDVIDGPLTITTHYTVSGGSGAVGTVNTTFTPAVGQSLTVERIVPTTQNTDLVDGDPFRATTQENTYDIIVMMIQQLRDLLSRTLIGPATLDPTLNGIVIPAPLDEHILVGANGQEYELRSIDDLVAGSGFSLSSIRVYNASATWTKPTNFEGFLIVEGVGGGGGGAGVPSTTGSQCAAGGGGGAGGYSWARIADVDLAATVAVTVGAGGGGGSAGANSGSAGGDSSFGSAVVAKGGSGGSTMSATDTDGSGAGGVGGLASAGTGDLTADGGDGQTGVVSDVGSASRLGQLGDGGSNVYGGSAFARVNSSGATGKKYGGGGSAAANLPSQSARAGGAGHSGVVIVYQFGGSAS